MSRWRIYYPDDVVEGRARRHWRAAPDRGVQVVALMEPPTLETRHFGGGFPHVTDRRLWTGVDEYDPFGWGPKYGSLIADADYWRVWIEAAYDGQPPEGVIRG